MNSGQKTAAGWITAVAVTIAVASYIVSMFVGTLDIIVSPDLGTNLASFSGNLILEVFLLAFETPVQTNVLAIVVIAMVIFVMSFAKAATANGGFRSGVRILLKGSRPRSLPNWLALMPLAGSSLFIIVLVLTLIQSGAGVSTGTLACPAGTPTSTCNLELFTSIITAPVAEEFGFRITPIGLAVAILVAIALGRNTARGSHVSTSSALRLFFSAFISPGYAKEKAGLLSVRTGGLKGISPTEWVMLFFTATVFGAYHIFGGGGWGPGKFVTAALSGFALGLVYLAYGAFADILLHWFFNFYFVVFTVNTPFNGIIMPIGDSFVYGVLALGVWGIALGIYWISKWKPNQLAAPTSANPWDPQNWGGPTGARIIFWVNALPKMILRKLWARERAS